MIKAMLSQLIPAGIKGTVIHRMLLPRIAHLKKIPTAAARDRDPIVIFTRAFNRLEYTIRCVESVARQKTNIPYIHVVLDQASEDGTEQWANWVLQSGKEHWRNVAYVRLKKNIGDWGGVVLGLTIAGAKYSRLIQLDNDIEMLEPDTIDAMAMAMNCLPGDGNLVMCRRIGAGASDGKTGGDVPLGPHSHIHHIRLGARKTGIYEVNHAVACYLSHTKTLTAAVDAGCDAACKVCDSLSPRGRAYKLHDLAVIHMDGWDGSRYRQREKYYRGSVAAGMKYCHIPVEEIRQDPAHLIDYAISPCSDSTWTRMPLPAKEPPHG